MLMNLHPILVINIHTKYIKINTFLYNNINLSHFVKILKKKKSKKKKSQLIAN